MTAIILTIHIILCVALIGIVLLQRSEGGLGGLGGGGGGGFMSARGTANLLTRVTAILTAGFMITSLALTILAGRTGPTRSILDTGPLSTTPPAASPESTPATPSTSTPAAPEVPVAK